MDDSEAVKQIWKKADAVTLDFDSTVIQELALYELAKFCGKTEAVINLVNGALKTKMAFKRALKESIEAISPSFEQIENFNKTRALNASPRVRDCVALLQSRHVDVYLIAGSFDCFIEPIADLLRIPYDNIYANKLTFFYSGKYAGFLENEPTTECNGKSLIIKHLKDTYGYQNLVHVGDGFTDLETIPAADAFIGYGGNIVREGVKQECKWYVMDFRELIDELLKQ